MSGVVTCVPLSVFAPCLIVVVKSCAVRTDGNLDRVDRKECVDIARRVGAVERATDRSAVGAGHSCAGGPWGTCRNEVHVGRPGVGVDACTPRTLPPQLHVVVPPVIVAVKFGSSY